MSVELEQGHEMVGLCGKRSRCRSSTTRNVRETDMKRMATAVLVALCLSSVGLYAAKGTVALVVKGCDYYVVDAPLGYAVLEWYGGNVPQKGDVLAGDFESYGMKDLYNLSKNGAETRVWVENYWLSKSRAIDIINDKCD
jgi:hypothetical protein